MINYGELVKNKALALLAKLPQIVKVDSTCYHYHDYYGYFAWMRINDITIPLMVSIKFQQEPLDTKVAEFTIKQLYCRYYNRNPLVLNLLDKTPEAANVYFGAGYDVETFINIYNEVPFWRTNYFVNTPAEIGEILHYIDTCPLDGTTGLKEKVALIVGHATSEHLPNLTASEIELLKQQTAEINYVQPVLVDEAALATKTAYRSSILLTDSVDDSMRQLRQLLESGLQQCQQFVKAPRSATIDLKTVVTDLRSSDFTSQVVTTYSNGQSALSLTMHMNHQIEMTVYQPNGQIVTITARVLVCSLIELLKKLVQQAETNGQITFKI